MAACRGSDNDDLMSTVRNYRQIEGPGSEFNIVNTSGEVFWKTGEEEVKWEKENHGRYFEEMRNGQ